jgi:hypothetical protein
MTQLAAILVGIGAILSAFGAAAQLEVLWMRHANTTTPSASKSLVWSVKRGGAVLLHALAFKSVRGQVMSAPDEEAGGVALRFLGAFLAFVGLLVSIVG